MNIALITAGGTGTRIQQDIPKQFLHIENKPIIAYTLEAFQIHPSIDAIIVACLDGWHDVLKAYAKQYNIDKLKWIVNGGMTGYDSIHNCLIELKKYCTDDDTVLIHDGNRCLISQQIISDGLSTYVQFGNAVAVIPCTEVVFKRLDDKTLDDEIPREQLLRTQTPHIFSFGKIWQAHNEAEKRNLQGSSATCSLMKLLGEELHFFNGSEKNIKITTLDDIDIFRAILNLDKMTGLKGAHVQ
jgi:2-C-methyl-D-erythritol 4-phosphate cytidylyltransferase